MAAVTLSPSSPQQLPLPQRTPTEPSSSSNRSTPVLPHLLSKRQQSGMLRSSSSLLSAPPRLLNANSPVALRTMPAPPTPSVFTTRERVSLAINSIILVFLFLVYFYCRTVQDNVAVGKVGVKLSTLISLPCISIITAITVNICFILGFAALRFVKKLFGGNVQRDGVKLASPIVRSLLRDSVADRTPPLAIADVTAGLDAPQTPLRSPFAKQSAATTPLSSAQPSQPSSSTPKILFTPTSRSLNLRTPSSILLNSSSSPFRVKTPMESEGRKGIGAESDSQRGLDVLLIAPRQEKEQEREGEKEGEKDKRAKGDFASEKLESVERRILRGHECLSSLSLHRDFEDRIEQIRSWLWSMIVCPLVNDIDRVESAFQANGMSHLGPLCPASITLLSPAHFDLRSAFFVSPGTISAASRPQTLMELAQQYRHDPLVQTRLRIEKYLDVAAGAGQIAAGPRIVLVKRLRAIAVSPFIPPDASSDDALLFMHLFCTFLDEHLPSSDLYSSQPFTSRYFIPFSEHLSAPTIDLRGVPVAIVQTSRSPPLFAVLAGREECYIPVTSNSLHACLHSLVFFVAYVEKRLAGHLGVANLGSRSIRLVTLSSDG